MPDTLGEALLARARNAIATEFGAKLQAETAHEALAHPGATFVTLTEEDGQLRGDSHSSDGVKLADDTAQHTRPVAQAKGNCAERRAQSRILLRSNR